jgi:hypothetical protein
MRPYWHAAFGLNCERSISIGEEDLGKDKPVKHKRKRYAVKIPEQIDKKVTLRLRGLGRTRKGKTGDPLLHIYLNKGDDIARSLWLSESSASNGTNRMLRLADKRIWVVIPPGSHDGLVIRLRGLGVLPSFSWRAPFLHRRRGNLLVKLSVYPDDIAPRYGSFDMLATDDMALEGWVYQNIDRVIRKIGTSASSVQPLRADRIAQLFNEDGWTGVYRALLGHLDLAHYDIDVTESALISLPGSCQRTAASRENTPATYSYLITINRRFLDNPFSVAAIMAHELCHVVYSEKIDDRPKSFGYTLKTDKESLEEERTVDLLVFMLKIGEFQLRVARDTRLTLGYFNQAVFERMQVIVSRKLSVV